jgi:soluble lytic murein transglycosylase-like protein
MWFFFLMSMQDVEGQADRVRAAMEASIAQQRASIQKQIESMPVAPTPVPWRASMAVPLPRPDYACEPIREPDLAKMIDLAATEHRVDAALVREVARQESAFYPCAVSRAGAQGLMQLMPETQAQFSVRDPFNPEESLSAGTKLLKVLLERYSGNLALALGAYNAGATRVDQAAGIPPIPETQNYVSTILDRLRSSGDRSVITQPSAITPAR